MLDHPMAVLPDIYRSFAKIDGDKFSAFIVEGFEGFHAGPEEHKMGIKGSSPCSSISRIVKCRSKNLLGEPGKVMSSRFNISISAA